MLTGTTSERAMTGAQNGKDDSRAVRDASPMPLTPLSEYKEPPYRPKILVIAAFTLLAVVYGESVLLNWVGVVTPSGRYVIASGIQRAIWMLLVAVVVAALAVRLALAPPRAFTR